MSRLNSQRFRYTLLFLLAMTEVMPLALLTQAIPVLMRRNGASMKEIGAVFLAMFPWSLKAVWAPLVDKIGARSRLGRYKSWLLLTHPLLFLTVLLGSFVDLPTLLMHNRAAVLPALLWLTSVCAVADAASHGMAVNLLAPEERGLGNGLQTAGLMIGHLIGGGLMVILAGSFGWRPAILVIAACIFLTLPAIALYQEQSVDLSRTISLSEVVAFFKEPRKLRWLAVVALLPVGASLMMPAMEVLLVDRGFALREIGLVLGVLASAAGVVGGVIGGLAVKRVGRERAFYWLTLFCALCLAGVLLHRVAGSRPLLYFVISLPSVGIMARATVLHVLMMDRCRGHIASTDFTIQYTVQQLSRLVFASMGAFVAGALGATTVFVLGPVLTIAFLVLAMKLLDRRDFQSVRTSVPPAA